VHYVLLILLVSGLRLNPAMATTIGATGGAITNYLLNNHYNFKGNRKQSETAPRFFLMVAFGIALNGMMLKTLTSGGVNYLLAQVITTGGVLLINFFVCKTWIFRKTS
jgi:putative flippase GtrA